MNGGDLAILNCTNGDTKISFNTNDAGEVERAKAVVEDMLRRGYCIAVTVGDKMERVTGFDSKRSEYIVRDDAPAKRAGGRRKGVPVKSTKAYAVGPSAGGGFGVREFPLRRRDLSGVRT